jgi:hypothetical protein
MAVLKRQWRASLVVIALLAGVFLLWGRKVEGHTPGDEVISVPTTFASLDNGIHDADPTVGVVKIDGNLTIASGGSITCDDNNTTASACPITLVVTGNLEIQAGGSIHAENLGANGGAGGAIKITVGGNFTMRGPSGADAGAFISSKNFSGGDDAVGGKITIIVGGVTLDTSVDPAVGICGAPTGDILMETGTTITSDSAQNRAGDIALYAGHNITIHGLVSAEGSTGGGHGGAITIDACCDLFIGDTGVVTSQGRDPGPDRVHLEGCVVTIYGLVQSTGPAHQSAAPLCTPPIRPGKPVESSACVEIWAGTTLTIDSTGTHKGEINADVGFSGGTSGRGWIDILANGDILLNDGTGNDFVNPAIPGPQSDYLVHANMNPLTDSTAGILLVQSKLGKVDTFGRTLQANADVGSGGKGGLITVEAGGLSPVPGGDVNFHDASIQAIGNNTNNCPSPKEGGHISARSSNGQVLGIAGAANPAELNADGGNAPGNDDCDNPGDVTLQGCGPTAAQDGVNYTGTVTPAPPIILPDACLVPVVFPVLTAPEAYPQANCLQLCNPVTNTPTPTVTPTPTPTTTVRCPEDPNAILTRVVDPSKVADGVFFFNKLQPAYNAAGNGEVIGLFGKWSENVNLGGAKTLKITQCTSAQISAANGALPVWNVTSTGKLTIQGPDSLNGTIGWRVENGPHDLKAVRANNATQYGILVISNGNSVSWNAVAGNGPGAGIRVEGATNILKGGTVGPNNGDGVQLIGNTNTLSGATIQSNTGNGVLVAGNFNTVKSNSRINLNGGNGILVTGDSNTLSSNASESGKGNTLNGIRVDVGGDTNQLTDNKMYTNKVDGFSVFGSGNKLKSNQGINNTGFEFNIGPGNTDQTGNKANGVTCSFGAAGGTCN